MFSLVERQVVESRRQRILGQEHGREIGAKQKCRYARNQMDRAPRKLARKGEDMKRNRSLPYIDYRPTPVEYRTRSASLTVTSIMRAGRWYRAMREQARIAVQLYVCNRATPGDVTRGYLIGCALVVGVLSLVALAHWLAR